MRVTTFSRYFPATHPRKGEPTHFVEKILLSLVDCGSISMSKAVEVGRSFNSQVLNSIYDLRQPSFEPKHHTIRAGNRWKVGDCFSPRVWSVRPYASKQIEFAPGIEIKKIWTFEVDENGIASLDGTYLFGEHDKDTLAKNDGLSFEDFHNWLFAPCMKRAAPFSGQVICWNESVQY